MTRRVAPVRTREQFGRAFAGAPSDKRPRSRAWRAIPMRRINLSTPGGNSAARAFPTFRSECAVHANGRAIRFPRYDKEKKLVSGTGWVTPKHIYERNVPSRETIPRYVYARLRISFFRDSNESFEWDRHSYEREREREKERVHGFQGTGDRFRRGVVARSSERRLDVVLSNE